MKKVFSNEFKDVCYEHLLYGQCKQQAMANWLNTTQQTRNWNISIPEQTLTLSPGTDTELIVPLQVIGMYKKADNVYLLSEYDQFLEIPEFKNRVMTECPSDIGYVLSALTVSLFDLDGYYVGYGLNENDKDSNLMYFLSFDELGKYSNFNRDQALNNLDLESLMESWDYVFSHLCPKVGLDLKDNVKILTNLFEKFGIKCAVSDIANSENLYLDQKMTLAENQFNLQSITFDKNAEIYALNDIVLAEHDVDT